MGKYLLLLFTLVCFFSCNTPANLSAQEIVDKAIEVSGGKAYNLVHFEYDFRDRHYITKLNNGSFSYTRITRDSVNQVRDQFTNSESLQRFKNDKPIVISDSLAGLVENSINSVNYFVLLPYGLNDAAVNKEFVGETSINNQDYYKIKVTFNQEGGGDDFEDVYVYWINKYTFKVAYLAYSYQVNGGGMRFREAYNERYIKGIRFMDYNNYKPKSKKASLQELDNLFEKGKLELLSKIETENIVVH